MFKFFCCCKFCKFMVEGVKEIDYKDFNILCQYLIENGKIVLSCVIGIKLKYQCQLVMVVKCVCFLVLILYIDNYDV